jgi:hypothetical protein
MYVLAFITLKIQFSPGYSNTLTYLIHALYKAIQTQLYKLDSISI